jgi:lytic murein transglycosylase
MSMAFHFARAASVAVLTGMLATTAAHANCNDPRGFPVWLAAFKRDALAQGISRRAVEMALAGVAYDANVIARDRRQGIFKLSFEDFSARMISPHRMRKGLALMRQHAALLARIERAFGVPGAMVVAIWGLETDFGSVMGRFPVIQSVATLAYDCRRSEMFRAQLLDAIRIVERGDMQPHEMRGDWAGEIGQAQFLPSSYLKYAVDFDGSGRRDLIRSTPDALASIANYLKSHGWKRGEPYGPGTANFEVLREWNKAEVYRKTLAHFAERLAAGR